MLRITIDMAQGPTRVFTRDHAEPRRPWKAELVIFGETVPNGRFKDYEVLEALEEVVR